MTLALVPPHPHRCTVCGKVEAWGPTWSWYGSYRDLEEDPAHIQKFCSRACVAESMKAGLTPRVLAED